MKCETCFEWMSSYVDHELEEKELLVFEDHINHCTSCQEELRILREIVKDINNLEEVELPVGFHQQLMEKIQLEGQVKRDKIIEFPESRKKWYLNWRVVSGLAATFVFSVLIFETLNMNSYKEALPEMANIQPRTANIEKAESKMAMDIPQEDATMGILRMEGPTMVTWEIQTKEYEQCKNNIVKISEEMGLEKAITEDTIIDELGSHQFVIEISLDKDTKNLLASKLADTCKDDKIEFYGDDHKQIESPSDLEEILIITITEIN